MCQINQKEGTRNKYETNIHFKSIWTKELQTKLRKIIQIYCGKKQQQNNALCTKARHTQTKWEILTMLFASKLIKFIMKNRYGCQIMNIGKGPKCGWDICKVLRYKSVQNLATSEYYFWYNLQKCEQSKILSFLKYGSHWPNMSCASSIWYIGTHICHIWYLCD